MELGGCQKIDLESEGRNWTEESLFSETELNALAGSVSTRNEVGISLDTDVDDNLPELHESRETERTQAKGRYNLRKSLAWDAAFFTSAGVLDPEELSCMIIGTDKDEKHSLSGIQEDLTESNESISTLESDHLNFETLEDDLFVDIRASIQRSSKNASNLTNSRIIKPASISCALDPEELSCMITEADKGERHSLPRIQEDVTESTESVSTLESDHLNFETLEEDLFVDIRASIKRSSKNASNLTNSRINKPITEEVDGASISCLRKEDFASENEIPKPGSRKISSLQTVKTSSSLPKQNIGKQGSGKSIKKGTGHSQSTAKIDEKNLKAATAKIDEKNLKAANTLKTISNSISTSTAAKRVPIGTGGGKSDSGLRFGASVTVSSNGTQPPKVSSGARRALRRPTLHSKSSVLNSSTTSRAQSARSCNSDDSSSISMSSEMPAKSSMMTARRSVISSGNVRSGPSGSISETLSRASLKKKPIPSTLSAYLKSTRISSSVSPASSISEWSSVSSSSSSSVINSTYNTSLDTTSSFSVDGDTVSFCSRNPSTDQTYDRHQNQRISLPSDDNKEPSTCIVQGSLRPPSGLRMPSPKIGFFDGVKSSAGTPNGLPN